MDEYIKKQLRENEVILWEGRPHKVQIFEKAYMGHLINKWIISVILCALAGAYVLYASGLEYEMKGTVLVTSILLICAIGIAISPILMKGSLEKYYRYYITNERFIAYKASINPHIDWREIGDVKAASIEMIDATHGNIFIGPKNKGAIKGLRMDVRATYSEEYKNRTLPFCSVEHAMDAYDFFPSSIKVEKIKADGKITV